MNVDSNQQGCDDVVYTHPADIGDGYGIPDSI
jgi:hypothetical protein